MSDDQQAEAARLAFQTGFTERPATGDVVETLARGLDEAYGAGCVGNPFNSVMAAAALLAQIAPTLRAEGMERQAVVMWETAGGKLQASKEIRAEAKRLREGGEG